MSSLLVILGNGPSLKGFDFRRLAPFDTIGMNAAYRYWYEIGYFPRYYVCLDKVVGLSHKDQIEKLIRESDRNGIQFFLLRKNLVELLDEDLQRSERILDFDDLRASIDLFDPIPFTTGSHSALFGALLGYGQIVLMGIDCNYVEKVESAKEKGGAVLEISEPLKENPNYFFEGYQAPGDRYNIPNPAPDMHLESWRAVAPMLAEKGVKIWNASPISRVDVFPFRDYTDIEAAAAAGTLRPPSRMITPPKTFVTNAQTDKDSDKKSSRGIRFGAPLTSLPQRLLPAAPHVRIAIWTQRKSPTLLALVRFAVWCFRIVRRYQLLTSLAMLVFIALIIVGFASAKLGTTAWLSAVALALGAATAAVMGSQRATLLKREQTHQLTLALMEQRMTAERAAVASGPSAQKVRPQIQVSRGNGVPEIEAAVECVWPAHALLGEGCCWDPRSRKVYWTDIKGAHLHAFSPDNGSWQSWRLPFQVGSVGIPPDDWKPPARIQGDLFLACGDQGLMWLGLDETKVSTVPIADAETHLPKNRYNDGKVGPDGRYWAGTMHDSETEPTGNLYAFSKDGSYALMDRDYRVPNGPAFSPDGRIVYHADSGRQTVYAFDLAPEGHLMNKRRFATFEADKGSPDGMTTDSRGNLWIAFWDGSRIEKLSPEGHRIGRVPLPTPRVTSCVFADEGDEVMYATSASIGVHKDDTLAGGLFKIVFSA